MGKALNPNTLLMKKSNAVYNFISFLHSISTSGYTLFSTCANTSDSLRLDLDKISIMSYHPQVSVSNSNQTKSQCTFSTKMLSNGSS